MPLSKREAFLGLQVRRLKPGFLQRVRARHALALEKSFPFPEQRKRKMRQRREIPAGPDRALLRNDRADVRIQHPDEEFDDLEPNPAEAQREDVGPEQHHCAHLRLRERAADAAGMAAHEIDLELLQFVRGNVHVGQLSEAGADTVNDGAPRDDLLHHSARSTDRFLGRGCDLDWLMGESDLGDFRQR